MKDVRVGESWIDLLKKQPHVNKMAEDISRLLDKSENPIWIQVSNLDIAPVILDLLFQKCGVTSGFVLKDQVDISNLDTFKFESLGEELLAESLLRVGLSFSDVMEIIKQADFVKVKRVWEEGEFSQMGDSLSIWPWGYNNPFRIEFDFDEVAKIKALDVEEGRSGNNIQVLSLLKHNKQIEENFVILKSNLSVDESLENSNKKSKTVIFSDKSLLGSSLGNLLNIYSVGVKPTYWDSGRANNMISQGWNIWAVVNHNLDNLQQIKKLVPQIKIFEEDLAEGFESEELKLQVLTDQELWGVVKLANKVKRDRGKYSEMVLDEINPGDYVVHEDHGVALYGGLKDSNRDSDNSKYLELRYAKKDKLLVPVSQVKKITKYIGAGTASPKLTRLGGGEWNRIKKKVSESVKELASELLRLYAVREISEVKPVSYNSEKLEQFINDFEFEETTDQLKAFEEIKADLEANTPMDRLLVGDVGFGKTEVAMRAALMIAMAGGQVAVLAPTTVLVEQHSHVFAERMSKFGINVKSLSRFLNKEEELEVIDGLEKGSVDVVIGTHKLLSNSIKYKNLKLLIIDEEQKFGVSQKEKMKNLRVDVHVLSMSATPIPRTLNMALSGVRDVSIIATPPKGRIAVKNRVGKFDWDLVKDAIKFELDREGQVYFVHNRVASIGFLKQKLEDLMPGVRFAVGHGQMSPESLSRIMHDFNEKKYDVLICSTIIENGIDMPNVNTLIIDHAEMLGLSQLYQIRGRIGRSDKQGFAYFFYRGVGDDRVVKRAGIERFEESKNRKKNETSNARSNEDSNISGVIKEISDKTSENEMLWDKARNRLDAINQLQDLGSGFNLARRDLEIRGAGNFLGKEQHGNVSSIGFSLYCRLLGEQVQKLKKTSGI